MQPHPIRLRIAPYLIILLISTCRVSLAFPSALRLIPFRGRLAPLVSARYFHQNSEMNTPKKQSRSSSRLDVAKKIITGETVSANVVTPVKETAAKKTLVKKTPLKTPASSATNKRRRVVTPETTAKRPTSRKSSTKTVILRDVPDSEFEDLKVPPEELRPSTTLTTGQCFHWKAISRSSPLLPTNSAAKQNGSNASKESAWGNHNDTEWIGCLRVSSTTLGSNICQSDSVVVVIRETPTTTLYRVLHAPSSNEDTDFDIKEFLMDYFQLDQPLAPLYEEWSQQDATRLGRIAACIPGVRILNQDPWECLASFICSSNNNIPRITQILQSIRLEYGVPLVIVKIVNDDGDDGEEEIMHSFPSLQELRQKATDADLRKKCGMGYRAKYILETMELLQTLGGEGYLHGIKEGAANGTLSPVEVQNKLIEFCGVGQKVADCVALFSLKQAEAIPVDTHVWNIACRDYDEGGQLKLVKSLTPKIYRQVGDIFRDRFENKAGWAHSLLFVAELPSFRPVLPQDMVDEMEKFRAEEQARKKIGKK